MKIELWFDRHDWTVGVSWWRRRYGGWWLDITINFLCVKIDVMFKR